MRLTGQPPVKATRYELESLRCNLCGQVFTAEPPASAGHRKYDATVIGIIAVLKYGSGVPFHRLQRLESQFGIPLPAATAWELLAAAAVILTPVWSELMR
ncbi:MAG TPA: hypothetical protein VJX67_10710 [Blastocatellia bacterium]|nr:hypothetical protein [Blastocatellia bacterium]